MTAERNYSLMSPEDLQAELGQLFEYAPTRTFTPGMKFSGLNAEITAMMSQRLERILGRSELTASMQQLIAASFSISTRMGMENADRSLLLGNQNPFTAGGGELVGRQLIERYAQEYQKSMDIIIQLQVEGLEHPMTDTLRLFVKAKQEFEEKYRN